MSTLKQSIEETLKKKLSNKVKSEAKSIIMKDMNAYASLNSKGVANSTTSESKKPKR